MKPELHQIRPAEERFPDLFLVIDQLISYFSKVVDRGRFASPSGHLELVRFSAVVRAYNLLKSIRQLLASDHWENAAILMRSLFELVLNIEELERDPATAELQAERFCRFEALQRFRRIKANSDYATRTHGRARDPRVTALEQTVPQFFAEWIEKQRPDGTIKWKTSWCGKNVRQLCEASRLPVRLGQYEVVYAYGSDMAHSSPRSVLSTHKTGGGENWEASFIQMEASERQETLYVVSLAVTFACEVIGLTKFLGGAFDPLEMLRITRGIFGLQGVNPPALHPELEAAIRKADEAAGQQGTVD